MRRRKPIAVLTLTLAALVAGCTGADSGADAEILFFYVNDCDRCSRMKDLLNNLLSGASKKLRVAYYEMEANQALLSRLCQRYGLGTKSVDVPVIFVGRTAIVGDGLPQELSLRTAVEACADGNCPSPLK